MVKPKLNTLLNLYTSGKKSSVQVANLLVIWKYFNNVAAAKDFVEQLIKDKK